MIGKAEFTKIRDNIQVSVDSVIMICKECVWSDMGSHGVKVCLECDIRKFMAQSWFLQDRIDEKIERLIQKEVKNGQNNKN